MGSLGADGPGLSLSAGAGERAGERGATGSTSCLTSTSTVEVSCGVRGLFVVLSVLGQTTTLILLPKSDWPDSVVGGAEKTELASFTECALAEGSLGRGSESLTGIGGLCKAFSLDVEGTAFWSVVKTPMAWFPNVGCTVTTEGWWACELVGCLLDPDAWLGKVLAPHLAAGRISSRWGEGCGCQMERVYD